MSGERPDYSRSHAILIGSSKFQDREFSPLQAAANSLSGFYELLTDRSLCGWPASQVTVFHNPTNVSQTLQAIRRIARDTSDVLLIYFVGHGTVLRRGQLCLILADTDHRDPDITGIEFGRIRETLLDSPARTKVAILDCCYSGRAIEALAGSSSVADSTFTQGTYTLTASDHTAHVPPPTRTASVCTSFTGELLHLVRSGIPGTGPDLTLNDLYVQLRHRLRSRGLPEPNQRGTDTIGQFAFSRNPAWNAALHTTTDSSAAVRPQPVLADRLPPERRLLVFTPIFLAISLFMLILVNFNALAGGAARTLGVVVAAAGIAAAAVESRQNRISALAQGWLLLWMIFFIMLGSFVNAVDTHVTENQAEDLTQLIMLLGAVVTGVIFTALARRYREKDPAVHGLLLVLLGFVTIALLADAIILAAHAYGMLPVGGVLLIVALLADVLSVALARRRAPAPNPRLRARS
jgi:hypothetical protein